MNKKEFYLKNRERILEQRKQYYKLNREKILSNKKIKYKKLNNYNKKYHEQNKEEIHLRQKNYRENNKEYFKRYREKNSSIRKINSRKSYLKRVYGITLEDFMLMGNNQNWKCLICSKELSPIKMLCCIDHDHASNRIRGLLCNECNVGLGNFRDNILFLENAIIYLKNNAS